MGVKSRQVVRGGVVLTLPGTRLFMSIMMVGLSVTMAAGFSSIIRSIPSSSVSGCTQFL